MNKPDGGPAFPGTKRVSVRPPGGKYIGHYNGMTLRDYFAGQAIAGLMATMGSIDPGKVNDGTSRVFAECAYEVADRMLTVREQS